MLRSVFNPNSRLTLNTTYKEVGTLLLNKVRLQLVPLKKQWRVIKATIKWTFNFDLAALIQQVVYIIKVSHWLASESTLFERLCFSVARDPTIFNLT